MNPRRFATLLIATAIGLLPCAGLASADVVTSAAGAVYEGNFHATSEGHVVIDNPIATIGCLWTLEGEVEGSASSEPIDIPLSSLTFSGCTNSWHVTVASPGTLEVHGNVSGNNGTVTWSGATIEATRFNVTCRYKTEATSIGSLTGSSSTGVTATIDLSGALEFHSGSFLCGEGATTFTGNLRVATPDYLDVDAVLGDVPTSPAGTIYEGKLHATSEGHVAIDNPIATINCNWTLEGEIKALGAGEPIEAPLSLLTFTGCTNSWHVTLASPGTLETHANVGSNGTVTWSGATIEATRFSVTCRYKTEATDIGSLTGSKTTGATATIDLSGALKFHSGSFLCGEGATTFTGSLKFATPDYLDVDAEI